MNNSSTDQKDSWTQRVDRRIRESAPLLVAGLIVLLVSSAFTIGSGIGHLRGVYESKFRWKQEEYSKLQSLHAGFSVQKFNEVLGSPLFVRADKENNFVENTYEGRQYWVQAIADSSGTVKLFAVTSCDLDFQPKITSPVGEVTLNKTRFAETTFPPSKIRYAQSGATANSHFYDEFYGGNPQFYKTYIVGIDDACPTRANYSDQLGAQGDMAFVLNSAYDGMTYAPGDLRVEAYRKNSVVNTYAETDIFVNTDSIIRSFQIGANRLLVRTVPPWK
jgi:hypothetical protein